MKSVSKALLCDDYCNEFDPEPSHECSNEIQQQDRPFSAGVWPITKTHLLDCIAECLQMPRLSELYDRLQLCSFPGIKADFLISNNLFPIMNQDNELWLATNNPFKIEVVSLIEKIVSKPVKLFLGADEEIQELKLAMESELLTKEKRTSSDPDDV